MDSSCTIRNQMWWQRLQQSLQPKSQEQRHQRMRRMRRGRIMVHTGTVVMERARPVAKRVGVAPTVARQVYKFLIDI